MTIATKPQSKQIVEQGGFKMDSSTQIIKILDDLARRFGVVIDWSQKNIFPYLQTLGDKITRYSIAKTTLWLAVWIWLLVLLIFVYRRTKKKLENTATCPDRLNDTEIKMIWAAIGIGILVIASLVCIESLMQHIFLPEKTIIEFIRLYLK